MLKQTVLGSGCWVPIDHVLMRPITSPLFPRVFNMKRSRTGKGDAPYNDVARGYGSVALHPLKGNTVLFGRFVSPSFIITLGSFSIRTFILLQLAGTTSVAANASA